MIKKYILEKIVFKKLEKIYFFIEKNDLNKNDLDYYVTNIQKILDSQRIYMNYFYLYIQDDSLSYKDTRNSAFRIELSCFYKNPLMIHKIVEMTYDIYNNFCLIKNDKINFKEISIFNLIQLNKYLKLFQLELENKINNDKNEILNYFNF